MARSVRERPRADRTVVTIYIIVVKIVEEFMRRDILELTDIGLGIVYVGDGVSAARQRISVDCSNLTAVMTKMTKRRVRDTGLLNFG